MDLAAKQAELDGVTWYHKFDFGGGLWNRIHSPHIEDHRRICPRSTSASSPSSTSGRGTATGASSRRGARSVLASDDLGQNWSQGRGIHLAKELLGSSIQINQNLLVYDLASLGRKFDVILFWASTTTCTTPSKCWRRSGTAATRTRS